MHIPPLLTQAPLCEAGLNIRVTSSKHGEGCPQSPCCAGRLTLHICSASTLHAHHAMNGSAAPGAKNDQAAVRSTGLPASTLQRPSYCHSLGALQVLWWRNMAMKNG